MHYNPPPPPPGGAAGGRRDCVKMVERLQWKGLPATDAEVEYTSCRLLAGSSALLSLADRTPAASAAIRGSHGNLICTTPAHCGQKKPGVSLFSHPPCIVPVCASHKDLRHGLPFCCTAYRLSGTDGTGSSCRGGWCAALLWDRRAIVIESCGDNQSTSCCALPKTHRNLHQPCHSWRLCTTMLQTGCIAAPRGCETLRV